MKILAANANGKEFLLAQPAEAETLPELKRLHAQLATRTDIPVVVSAPEADSRQRKALVAQGVPFICAGKQASLPFLGAASTEWGKAKLEKPRKAKLTPTAQQAAIWGALHGGPYTLAELREATGMSASQASIAVEDLVARGMASRNKKGRTVTVTPINQDELLDRYMPHLSSPVLRTVFMRRDTATEVLPDAGENTLAAHSALNPPAVTQKAASRAEEKALSSLKILEGELSDDETMQVQIWKYAPLFTDADQIDSISMALSFAGNDDERIESEIDSLFGRELAWREAR